MRQRPEAVCTIILIAVNVAVFFILSLFGDTEDAVFMMQHGAMYSDFVIQDHEYYRLFTCLFLHFGIEHLLNNMVILGALGWNLELQTGKIRSVGGHREPRETGASLRARDAGHGSAQPVFRSFQQRCGQLRPYRRSGLWVPAGAHSVQKEKRQRRVREPYQAGRDTVKTVSSPGTDLTVRVPSWASAICRAMESPSPVPFSL